MAVALFTSRIVLQALGVTDFGINNVVAGVVGLFGFLSGTLMSITQRFITVELGKGNNKALQKIFSTSMLMHISIGVLIIIVAETFGLWFLENKLVIPADRMTAARWVFQFTIFGFFLSLFNAPLMALITAHEDMHIYGYLGILDVLIRLATAYLLIIINVDKLMFFSIFGFTASCIVSSFYLLYCRKKYHETRFSFVFDKSLLREFGGFGGFVFIGNIFWILQVKGINILLNMFYGPAVNAAAGLSNSANGAVLSFANNFRQALNPPLTKSYAINQKEQAWNLLEYGTRFSFFLLLIFSVPLILETDFILKLWLKNVPEFTAIITKLMLLNILVEATFVLINTLILANGKLKTYYTIAYINSVLFLLFSYLSCKMSLAPYFPYIILPVLSIFFIPIRFFISKKELNLPVLFFIKKALLPIGFVSLISFFPFYFLKKFFINSPLNSFFIIIISIIWTCLCIILFGLRKSEILKIIALLKSKLFANAVNGDV